MSHQSEESAPKVTIPMLRQWRAEGRKLVMVTAYDAAQARLVDPLTDIILVGDSMGNVVLGFDSTLQVTVEMMNHHLEAVARTKPRALLVADMPYLSFHLGKADTLANAGGFIRRGAAAVKLEGGTKRLDMVKALVDCEIPVMGHLGLTPQSVNVMGGYKVQGRSGGDALILLDDARRLEEAGCFSIVLEGIPSELAARVTETLSIPTIGIGAGPDCSGQVLVLHDILGLLPGKKAKFVRTYLDGYGLMQEALSRWADDIRSGNFPGPEESYAMPKEARAKLAAWHGRDTAD